MSEKVRCAWAGSDPIYVDYHDNEWGRPVHDDRLLFEMLVLEGAQAGLSWITVLKKRQAYRQAFKNFVPELVANFGQDDIEQLLQNKGIIRNRLKVEFAVTNARAFLKVAEKHGSFDDFIWNYVKNTPIIGHFSCVSALPAHTPLSDKISKDLKKLGFRFVGSTIVYSFMQAIGMVNDHTTDCFVYQELRKQ